MHNLIFQNHDKTDAPTTFFRNKNGKVLDGIWGTANISAVKCGYLEPCDFPGDHSAVWLDITSSPRQPGRQSSSVAPAPHSEEVPEDVQD